MSVSACAVRCTGVVSSKMCWYLYYECLDRGRHMTIYVCIRVNERNGTTTTTNCYHHDR
jgi:hypothetical protein